ncbi:MAG: hypothetical protein KUG65_12265 [Sphingomonadaceae bacterium]|nr:hypothetical protein [Sphingomonadaceae bacterium]
MTPKFNISILVILLLIAIPSYWLLFENNTGTARPKPVTIAQLRSLAGPKEGPAPRSIRFEQVASRFRTRNLVAAGYGMRWERLYIFAYMLEYRNRAPAFIGAGISEAQTKGLDYRSHEGAAQKRVALNLANAGQVIPLEQANEQLGGLEMLAERAVADRLREDIHQQWQKDAKGTPYALAPGIVIIPTPGLRSKSRLVYVRLTNGREYLFAGSLAPIHQSWTKIRAPARIVTDHFRKDDRQEIFSWLLTLRALKRESHDLIIVSGNRIPGKSGIRRYFPQEDGEDLALAIAEQLR